MVKKAEIVNETPSEGIDLRPLPMAPACAPGTVVVGVHRLHDQVEYPEYHTDSSSCFDLRADLSTAHIELKCWEPVNNTEVTKKVRDLGAGRYLLIEPGERVLIPTGLSFEFPAGYGLNTFIRSGVGLKKGLVLANAVGVIDEDYRAELYLPIINTTKTRVRIENGERLVQAEVRPVIQAIFDILDERPSSVGNRNGGFGSTGAQ